MNALLRILRGMPALCEEEEPLPEETTPVVQLVDSAVQRTGIIRIGFDIQFEGVTYLVEGSDFSFHERSTHVDVAIQLAGRWRVKESLMLTYSRKPNNCEDKMKAAFATRGFLVKRELVRACLDPLTLRVLEMENMIQAY